MLLLLLLVLSSVRLLDAVKTSSLDQTDTLMIPNLEDKKPKITANVSTTKRILPPTYSRPKRHPLSNLNTGGRLQWKQWNNGLPNGTVSIYNGYVGHTDYVCKVGCESGFYRPDKGPFCHYPIRDEEKRGSSFDVLVNEDNFEILEWKEGYKGSLPKHSVRTCSSENIYVGKNKYGLGKVIPHDRCIYIPWEGTEIWYWGYEVLTTRADVTQETISEVEYNINQAKVIKNHPKTLKRSTIKNADCRQLKKTTTFTTSTRETKTWDIKTSIMAGIKTTIKTGVPLIVEGHVELSAQISFDYSKGQSITEESTHTVSLELQVPPNHSCTIRLVGSKYNEIIPFTARLSRTYGNGETKQTTINGTYHGVETLEVHCELDRCQLLPNAEPCPKQK